MKKKKKRGLCKAKLGPESNDSASQVTPHGRTWRREVGVHFVVCGIEGDSSGLDKDL